MKIDFAERRSVVLQGVRVVIESELWSGNYTMEPAQRPDSVVAAFREEKMERTTQVYKDRCGTGGRLRQTRAQPSQQILGYPADPTISLHHYSLQTTHSSMPP